jgi:[FeFe] hydrogenase H-cluster maturation GTPase HydF
LSLNNTPKSNRLHIGVYGKRNTGKSSLINALTGHETAIVSPVAGTTTDPVYKSMEIYGLGPCVLIDTAGFDDDNGELGQLRVMKTQKELEKTDMAIIVFDPFSPINEEKDWIATFNKRNIPVIAVINKTDMVDNSGNMEAIFQLIERTFKIKPIAVSAKYNKGVEQIRMELIKNLPEDYDIKTITGGIVNEGDTVLLVMPQDIQAPKGRLILPQVQTLRELLDKKCLVLCTTTDKLNEALSALKKSPDVIITDSQVFSVVYRMKPPESKLTSFSVLFAAYKGDIDYYIKGASIIGELNENSRILIAEACTHAPLEEDIGRVKLPRLLRNRVGEKLTVDIVSGADFPEDLSGYDLVIQCGACMFNRRHVITRIEKASRQNVPMTNYGIAIAYLSGILYKISLN